LVHGWATLNNPSAVLDRESAAAVGFAASFPAPPAQPMHMAAVTHSTANVGFISAQHPPGNRL
jgi:hypothetical protein